ncbi:MAG TPA: hypothetical protein DDY82_04590 [Clostridiales bacterium]|nr:hypothetical protein [Clostridiales bacterium]
MDKKGELLLSYINGICKAGEYKIINSGEITLYSPQLFPDKESVRKAIKQLDDEEYIIVKFYDGEQYCLCSTIKGKEYFDNQRLYKKTLKKDKRIVFFASVLGSFLGSLITLFIFLLVK